MNAEGIDLPGLERWLSKIEKFPDMSFDIMYKAITEELEFAKSQELAAKVAWKMILIDSGRLQEREINGHKCWVMVK